LTENEAPPAAPAPAPGAALLREIIETVLLTAVIYAAVNFTSARFVIEGPSMEPTFHQWQRVLVNRLAYGFGDPQRGDVVVFNYPLATDRDFIKRVIGLPGETVDIVSGVVLVNGQPLDEPYIKEPPRHDGHWVVGAEQYFVMGDNRNSSSDSRTWGALDRKFLIGRAVAVYWPPDKIGWVQHFAYAAGS
jgi:signal peptidase I